MVPDGYSESDLSRWVDEPTKPSSRTEFERDRARVLHSAGFRRLALTTQVISPGSDSFVRNRLTHSLEVAQIARELGRSLGCDPDVVDAAGLAHDLGHPPFGHTGEAALNEVTGDIGGFEGNAQTLRVLTRLEPKTHRQRDGRPAGLNLTRATVDAVCKYPWQRGSAPGGGAKFGVYAADLDVYRWARGDVADGRRCLEAQVMDFADDVAYSVHDVEDAVVAGRLTLPLLAVPAEQQRIHELVQRWYLPAVTVADVVRTLRRLLDEPFWPLDLSGGRRGLAALKGLTSALIGRFSLAAEAATRERYGPGALSRYRADLVVPEQTRLEVAVLKGVAAVYVMTVPERLPQYERQRELVAGLYGELLRRAPEVLEPSFQEDWLLADDETARRRVVLDQVASLSDVAAVSWHESLVVRRRHSPDQDPPSPDVVSSPAHT